MSSLSARLFEPLEPRCLFTAVTGLTLINADTDQPIAGYDPIPAGAVLDLSTLPTRRLNIRASADSTVKSVRFGLDAKANYRTEKRPYALAANNGADYFAWTPSVGSHKVIATPFTLANAGGKSGTARTVNFSVVDAGTTTNPPPAVPPSAPPAGTGYSKVYLVSAGGPYTTIASAVRLAGPGEAVLIAPGTYHESLTLARSGQSGKPITIAAQTAGTVTLDGSGFKSVIAAGGASNIVLDGLTINGCANPNADDPAAVSVGNGWRLSNLLVQNTDGTGVGVYGNDVTLSKVTAQYNGRAGISGSYCTNVLVKDCVTRGNNTRNNDPDWDGGAGKWYRTSNVTIDGMTTYDNLGPGIWFDFENADVTIRNSRSYNNRGREHAWSGNGIRAEVSAGAITIENNTLYGNTGANLDLQSHRHATIRNNTFIGTTLSLLDWDRGSAYTMYDVRITDNLFDHCGVYTEGGTWNAGSPAAKAITFDRNRYKGGVSFNWGTSTYYSLADVRSQLGFEESGTAVA